MLRTQTLSLEGTRGIDSECPENEICGRSEIFRVLTCRDSLREATGRGIYLCDLEHVMDKYYSDDSTCRHC